MYPDIFRQPSLLPLTHLELRLLSGCFLTCTGTVTEWRLRHIYWLMVLIWREGELWIFIVLWKQMCPSQGQKYLKTRLSREASTPCPQRSLQSWRAGGRFPGQGPSFPCQVSLPHLHGYCASTGSKWSSPLRQGCLTETSSPLFFNGYKPSLPRSVKEKYEPGKLFLPLKETTGIDNRLGQ